jgi:hypothetical protein
MMQAPQANAVTPAEPLTRIAVVVPTVRPERFAEFLERWKGLFCRHQVRLVAVHDGVKPRIESIGYTGLLRDMPSHTFEQVPADIHVSWPDFLCTRTDAVRNIGFLAAMQRWPDTQVILTLDDDVYPEGGTDPIADHLAALRMRVPISWFSTASEYMRGMPYGVRTEAEVVVSHGVWSGVHDYDGPTQLVNGVKPATFYRGPVPKGCLTPVCGMNLAFKVSVLPWVYFAPMGRDIGYQRFADIWMGIALKRELDRAGLAMVSGYASVFHSRASNVLANLEQEAAGLVLNERLWLPELVYSPAAMQALPAAMQDVAYLKRWTTAFTAWRRAVADITGQRDRSGEEVAP